MLPQTRPRTSSPQQHVAVHPLRVARPPRRIEVVGISAEDILVILHDRGVQADAVPAWDHVAADVPTFRQQSEQGKADAGVESYGSFDAGVEVGRLVR